MQHFRRFARYLRRLAPFLISLVLIIIIVRLAPWAKVGRILADIDGPVIGLLIVVSLAYYAIKIVRFWYMLRALKINEPLGMVSLTYLAAQPVSLLPAGELYRAKILQTYRNVPLRQSVPTFTAQGLFEGLAIGLVGLVCSVAVGFERIAALILLSVAILGVGAIRLGYMTSVLRPLNALPFVHLTRNRLQRFSDRNQALFSGSTFWALYGLSITAEAAGVAIVYISIAGLGGHVTLFQAGLVYVVSIVVSFLSFLPGGIGASEESAIGVLLLLHQGGAIAVASTLVMRAALVATGLVYGAIGWVTLQLVRRRQLSR